MPNPDYAHLTLVTDRSGSMLPLREDVQGSITELLARQWSHPGKLTITIVEFNETVRTVTRMSSHPVDYQMEPRGMTALLDAVGGEIARTGQDLGELPEGERPGKVLFVVVTDGMENSSREHGLESVRAAVDRQAREYSWHFRFIGADDSAWQGGDLGMSVTRHSGTAEGTRAVYQVMSESMLEFRTAPLGVAFAMPADVDDADVAGRTGTADAAKRAGKAAAKADALSTARKASKAAALKAEAVDTAKQARKAAAIRDPATAPAKRARKAAEPKAGQVGLESTGTPPATQ